MPGAAGIPYGHRMQIGGVDLVDTGKRLFSEIKDDDLTGRAAELAYRFFLALFPFVIFLAALGGFIASAAGVANPAQRLVDQFGDSLPSDAASIIEKQVDGVVNAPNGGLLSISIIGALWASAGGVGAVMKATNRAYDVGESRPFWKKTLLSVGLTVSAGLAIIVGFVLMVVTQGYTERIAEWLGLGQALEWAILIVRWPLVLAVVMLAVSVIYWLAPNTGMPFKWVTPGAVFFGIGWLVMTTLLGIYVANFASYNATYGALGGVVVLLLWFYLTSLVMLIGAELNAVLDAEKEAPALEERRRKVADEIETRHAGHSAAGAMDEPQKGARAPARPGGRGMRGSTALLALVGVALAALAWRRPAR